MESEALWRMAALFSFRSMLAPQKARSRNNGYPPPRRGAPFLPLLWHGPTKSMFGSVLVTSDVLIASLHFVSFDTHVLYSGE